MLLSGIILVLSSLGLITMVAYRSWEIKKGRLTVLEDVPERFFSISELERGAEQFFKKARIFGIHAGLLSLSHFVSFMRQVRRSASEEWNEFAARLPKHLPEHRSDSSFFLKDITIHKEEVRRANGYHE